MSPTHVLVWRLAATLRSTHPARMFLMAMGVAVMAESAAALRRICPPPSSMLPVKRESVELTHCFLSQSLHHGHVPHADALLPSISTRALECAITRCFFVGASAISALSESTGCKL